MQYIYSQTILGSNIGAKIVSCPGHLGTPLFLTRCVKKHSNSLITKHKAMEEWSASEYLAL